MIGFATALIVAAGWIYIILDMWTTFIIWADKLFYRGRDLVNGTIPELLLGLVCYGLGWGLLLFDLLVAALPVYGIIRMIVG